GVRGGDGGPRLPPVLCAEHLQRRADVRADSADSGSGAGDLRDCRATGKAPPALELSTGEVPASSRSETRTVQAARSGLAPTRELDDSRMIGVNRTPRRAREWPRFGGRGGRRCAP